MKLPRLMLLLGAVASGQLSAATYYENVVYLDYPGLANVTFTKAPAPSVYASAVENSTAQGQMVYTFDIAGAQPGSYVPVDFKGTYNMVFQGDLPGLGQGRWSELGAAIYSGYFDRDGGFHYEGVHFSAHCNGIVGGCYEQDLGMMPPGQYSSISLTDTKVGAASISGLFQGTLFVPINATGEAVGVVNLYAYAGAFGLRSTSFIDPQLHINTDWLLANPGITLTLPDGVGNEISAVPEPTSFSLLALGLCLIGARLRRHPVVSAPRTKT
ncbi:MAG: PEP-CTERM sorting domain-containing protein [Sphingomonadaceae bacterium]